MNYGDLWSRLIFPAYERLRGKKTPTLEIGLALSQYESADALRLRRARDLERLLIHARATVPFYRRWFAESGADPAAIAASGELGPLPLVDKAMFMDNPADFHSAPAMPGTMSKATGGSTGAPLRLLLDPLSDQWRTAVYRRGYAWAGCREGDRQIYLWGADIMAVGLKYRLRRELFRRLARMRFYSSFGLGPAELDAVLAAVDDFHPGTLVGYTTAVEALARRALERGWRPRRPLGAVITGAEALSDTQRGVIEEAMGCRVFETYGCREFMLIAAECPEHNGMHISAENLIVEVLADGRPAAPGQLGEVVITDLHNFAQPFIRYKSGDLASFAAGSCPCGRTLPRLERVEGRILDMITMPDGRQLPGEFFPHFFKDLPEVRRFQVRQAAPGELVISIVPRGGLRPATRELILQKTAQALPGMRVDLRVVEDIPVTAAGKRRVTIGLGPGGGR